ncbi:MAG TPA: flagellar basal-body MS-ring/collar protein FliF [Terriglobales bacterium]
MEAPKSFAQAVDQLSALARGLTLSQKLLLGGGAALVGVTLWIFVAMMGTPKYVTLYSGLRASEAQEMAGRLAAKNIHYQLSPDGTTLLVPEDKLDASRLETAAQGLPRNARMGFELFDTPNWAGSDFTEKVNYQRALEGELERTLQTLSEVESARVHLVLPRESLFTEQESPAKAAVILKTRGGELSEQAQKAIPQLIASAVEGLRPENVTVVDADSNAPLLKKKDQAGEGYDLDEELSKNVVQTLEPVLGPGHVKASVHVEYDMGTSDDTEEVYDPKATATLSEQKTEETAGGALPAGVPGTASNPPGPAAQAVAASSENQNSRSESATYAVSRSMRHTTEPPGRIKRIAAAVLVDDAEQVSESNGKKTITHRKRTPEEMKQIEQLASAAIGISAQRGDLLSIENLSFQEHPSEDLPPARLEKIRGILLQWTGLLRYAGILLLFLIVYGLILRPVKKQIITAFRELPQRVGKGEKEIAGMVSRQNPGLVPGQTLDANLEAGLPAVEPAQRTQQLKKQLTEKIKAEPAAASRLVQSWIREPKS